MSKIRFFFRFFSAHVLHVLVMSGYLYVWSISWFRSLIFVYFTSVFNWGCQDKLQIALVVGCSLTMAVIMNTSHKFCVSFVIVLYNYRSTFFFFFRCPLIRISTLIQKTKNITTYRMSKRCHYHAVSRLAIRILRNCLVIYCFNSTGPLQLYHCQKKTYNLHDKNNTKIKFINNEIKINMTIQYRSTL